MALVLSMTDSSRFILQERWARSAPRTIIPRFRSALPKAQAVCDGRHAAPDIAKPALIWAVYLSFVKTYLWPLAIPLLLVLLYGLMQVIPAFGAVSAQDAGLALKVWLIVKL